MGVYVKGMEMPKSCYKCPMRRRDGMDIVCPLAYERFSVADVNILEYRLDDCPLVPVPPHGRLIDANALADIFRGFIAVYDSCPFSQLSLSDKARRDELQSALAEVIYAPTIILASEGDT